MRKAVAPFPLFLGHNSKLSDDVIYHSLTNLKTFGWVSIARKFLKQKVFERTQKTGFFLEDSALPSPRNTHTTTYFPSMPRIFVCRRGASVDEHNSVSDLKYKHNIFI